MLAEITRRLRAAGDLARTVTLALGMVVGAPVAQASAAKVADLAEQGLWTEFKAAVAAGRDVAAPQVDGMTALHWAVWADQTAAVKTLLDAGAPATSANLYGVTPLSLACTNGNGAIVTLLLDAGADANTTLQGGETALLTAARTGKIEVVRALLAHGAEIEAKEHKGQTALMWAAHEGHADIVQLLLSMGAQRETELKSGFTPWLFAVRQGHAEVVEVFLRAGQDVNAIVENPPNGSRGLQPDTSALILAVINGHLDLAMQLVAAGADPNDIRSGQSVLHLLPSVRKPHIGEDEDGMPPVRGSGRLTTLEFLDAIVAAGAEVNLRIPEARKPRRGDVHLQGVTPFFQAARRDDVPMMKRLLEHGADPTIGNVENCTPLLVAAGVGVLTPDEDAGSAEEAIAAISLLLELGADINHVDDNGETAMHGIAYKNVPTVGQFLASRGANPATWNQKNRYGWTPMHIAEGYRPGNFKPSAETVEGLKFILALAGIAPDTGPKPVIGDNY